MTERSEKLISLFLQDPFAMTDEQTVELSNWILQDTGNTKAFIESSLFHRSIHNILLDLDEDRNCILQEGMGTAVDSLFDEQLWNVLLKEEATAPKIEIEPSPAPEKELIQKVKRKKTVRKINKTTFLVPILSVAAMICLIIYVMLVPNTVNVEVATLTDSLDAQWAESSSQMTKNCRLMTNHTPLMLRKGNIEIVFDNNSKVVIEAPAEFQVLSYDQIKLNYGRLYATVPQEGLGFIVSTPNSKIIDLGTEFGVHTDINGTTELHVVKGKASLVSGFDDKKTNILVNAGSAKKVSSTSAETIDIACSERTFIRHIDSEVGFVWRGQNLNLADIVGGGNGFGKGRLNWGIESSTGQTVRSLATKDMHSGREGYMSVPSNPHIDGVFIPGIGWDMTQVTSSGVQTNEFPRTSGMLWGYILNGAWHDGFDVPHHNLQLNGVVVDGKTTPAITMHSNLGITFDLTAIRKEIPSVRIKSLSSKFGVSQTVDKWLQSRDFSNLGQSPEVVKLSKDRQATVEFWVFLDGQKVFRQKASSASEIGRMDIPIDQGIRFLTLAVTEADDTCMFDWALLARPEVILEASD